MKRFLSMIVAACAFFAVTAQNPMVTLSHDGELSFFTNIGAFKAAVDSAKNGDILYLSDGNFIVDDGSITIKKKISIVGNGYTSHIMGNLSINLASYLDSPLFDGVKLDKLTFSSRADKNYSSLGDCEITRCWIKELVNGGAAAQNVLYDKCYIEKANFDEASYSNVLVKNSKMNVVSGNGGNLRHSSNISVINCNINKADYYPLNMISTIFNNFDSSASSYTRGDKNQTFINSLIRGAFPSSAVRENCYQVEENLLDDNLECIIDLNNYLGQDGKEVGIHGGESPFSENPSVPTVDTANSSVEYDAENNKLKVSITVKAD